MSISRSLLMVTLFLSSSIVFAQTETRETAVESHSLLLFLAAFLIISSNQLLRDAIYAKEREWWLIAFFITSFIAVTLAIVANAGFIAFVAAFITIAVSISSFAYDDIHIKFHTVFTILFCGAMIYIGTT